MFAIEVLLSAAIPKVPPARRGHAARRSEAVVRNNVAYAMLVGPIELVLSTHRELAALRDEWKAQRDSEAMHGRLAVEIDNKLDRAVSHLFGVLEGCVRSVQDEVALAQAEYLLEWCFPRGAVAITNLPFVDQHDEVITLLGKLRDPDVADAVARLGLELFVQTIESLNQTYGELVTISREITPERVEEADQASLEAAAAYAAAVVGAFPTNEPDHVAARAELLGPFFDQKAELAKLRRRRSGADSVVEEGAEESFEDAEDATQDDAEAEAESLEDAVV